MVSLSNHVAKGYPVEFPEGNPIQQGERPYPGRSVSHAVSLSRGSSRLGPDRGTISSLGKGEQ